VGPAWMQEGQPYLVLDPPPSAFMAVLGEMQVRGAQLTNKGQHLQSSESGCHR
jgi:hypothetical protein